MLRLEDIFIYGGVYTGFKTLSNAFDEVSLAEVVHVVQSLTIFAKKLRYSCST